MGVASITVSATQLCEPTADEPRHREVFEACADGLAALQREWQASSSSSTGKRWRFALPNEPDYQAAALFGYMRRFVPTKGQAGACSGCLC